MIGDRDREEESDQLNNRRQGRGWGTGQRVETRQRMEDRAEDGDRAEDWGQDRGLGHGR